MNKKYILVGAFVFNTIMSLLGTIEAYKIESRKLKK